MCNKIQNIPIVGERMVMYNRGVFTLTESSLVSLQLKELEEKGIDVLACKTCVDFYG